MKKRINISIDAPLHAWAKLRATELCGGDFSLYVSRLIEREKLTPGVAVTLTTNDLDALRRSMMAEILQELRARPGDPRRE